MLAFFSITASKHTFITGCAVTAMQTNDSPSQEHCDQSKPRLQSSCVFSLHPSEWMPACLSGFHVESVWVCTAQLLCALMFAVLVWCYRSLGPENLLLKGATLKNTQKICGRLNAIDGTLMVDQYLKITPLHFLFSKVLQFTLVWRQRWLSIIRASLRNALLWRSKFWANSSVYLLYSQTHDLE